MSLPAFLPGAPLRFARTGVNTTGSSCARRADAGLVMTSASKPQPKATNTPSATPREGTAAAAAAAAAAGDGDTPVKLRYLPNGHVLEIDVRGHDFSTYVRRLREELLPYVTAWNAKSSSPHAEGAKHTPEREKENEQADLERAWELQTLVNRAFQLFVAHAPPALLDQLLRFARDSDAPVALAVRGLPVDDPLPPSPGSGSLDVNYRSADGTRANADANADSHGNISNSINNNSNGNSGNGNGGGREAKSKGSQAPVAEAVLMGLARVVGTPTTHAMPNGGRHDLAYNLLPRASECDGETPFTHLHLHRDFPHPVVPSPGELDAFALLAMRGDATGEAHTTVTGADALLAETPADDVSLLRSAPLHCEGERASTGRKERLMGDITWRAITGPSDDDPIVNFFSLDFGQRPDPSLVHSVASDTPGAADAYARLLHRAEQMADRVFLDTGSLLLINNLKAVHGRTSYKPRPARHPLQRWFVKSYISFAGWHARGVTFPSPLRFPKFHME